MITNGRVVICSNDVLKFRIAWQNALWTVLGFEPRLERLPSPNLTARPGLHSQISWSWQYKYLHCRAGTLSEHTNSWNYPSTLYLKGTHQHMREDGMLMMAAHLTRPQVFKWSMLCTTLYDQAIPLTRSWNFRRGAWNFFWNVHPEQLHFTVLFAKIVHVWICSIAELKKT